MVDVQPYLQQIVDQFSSPMVQSSLKGFTRVLLFRFTDSHEEWLIKTVDGKMATLVKDTMANPDIMVTTTTEVLTGVMDHKMNGLLAYMQRKIQVQGAMEDLMKIQKLLL